MSAPPTAPHVLATALRACLHCAPQADEFEIKAPDLGALTEITIGHDNTGYGPNWHLEQVEITDTKINQVGGTAWAYGGRQDMI